MRVGIIAAMDEEIGAYLRHFPVRGEVRKATLTFHKAQWKRIGIVIVKSGIGKTSAAMCTQLLIDHFKVNRIICTGVAGALNPALDVGDIIISKDCAHHDINLEFLGFKRGHIPYLKWRFFPGDKKLISMAKKAHIDGHRIVEGRILTGDIFVQDKKHVHKILDELQGDCIEMEGASVAQVCMMNKVPFVVIRSISDKADHSAPVDFPVFIKASSENAYSVVHVVLEQLAEVGA